MAYIFFAHNCSVVALQLFKIFKHSWQFWKSDFENQVDLAEAILI